MDRIQTYIQAKLWQVRTRVESDQTAVVSWPVMYTRWVTKRCDEGRVWKATKAKGWQVGNATEGTSGEITKAYSNEGGDTDNEWVTVVKETDIKITGAMLRLALERLYERLDPSKAALHGRVRG
jgi:hypothetical protein